MQYVKFGRTDMKVSEISLGAMQINCKPGFKGAEDVFIAIKVSPDTDDAKVIEQCDTSDDWDRNPAPDCES